MSDWQPIETAPKDEDRLVLLWFPEEQVQSVAYYSAYYAEGGYGCVDGFPWVQPCSGERLNIYYGTPTHWMPLPTPPQETENGHQ